MDEFNQWYLYMGVPMIYKNLESSSDGKYNGRIVTLTHTMYESRIKHKSLSYKKIQRIWLLCLVGTIRAAISADLSFKLTTKA